MPTLNDAYDSKILIPFEYTFRMPERDQSRNLYAPAFGTSHHKKNFSHALQVKSRKICQCRKKLLLLPVTGEQIQD